MPSSSQLIAIPDINPQQRWVTYTALHNNGSQGQALMEEECPGPYLSFINYLLVMGSRRVQSLPLIVYPPGIPLGTSGCFLSKAHTGWSWINLIYHETKPKVINLGKELVVEGENLRKELKDN